MFFRTNEIPPSVSCHVTCHFSPKPLVILDLVFNLMLATVQTRSYFISFYFLQKPLFTAFNCLSLWWVTHHVASELHGNKQIQIIQQSPVNRHRSFHSSIKNQGKYYVSWGIRASHASYFSDRTPPHRRCTGGTVESIQHCDKTDVFITRRCG